MDDLQVSFMVRATQAHANSKSLTAPKIMVLNGESGTIQVIKERAYVANISLTSDTSTSIAGTDFAVTYFEQEIDYLLTGIVLNVTPTITSDKKYVILRITTALTKELPSNIRKDVFTEVIGGGSPEQTIGWEQPVTEYTAIQTRTIVPDRGTVLLGGLTLTAEKEIEAGVPILSKIPLLGRLFSNRSEVKDKQVLLVLVKPTIILTEEAEEAAIAAMN
jgi:general secretion pathway protein D